MQSEVKICKDCEHCEASPLGFASYCIRDDKKLEITNLVSGEVEVQGNVRKCVDERYVGWLKARLCGLCGKEGRFFIRQSTETKL
jgi:hypothetical protein